MEDLGEGRIRVWTTTNDERASDAWGLRPGEPDDAPKPPWEAHFVGEVVEVATEVKKLRPGMRVVVGSIIGCGHCFFCQSEQSSLCDNTNPNPERLAMARDHAGAEILDYEQVDVREALREMTGGRGPDACIDCVGMEAHGTGIDDAYDRVKQAVRLETDRPTVLRQAIRVHARGVIRNRSRRRRTPSRTRPPR